MKYVLLRDDDTHARTPIECLQRLYEPFLQRGWPVNLAVIPEVDLGVRLPDGRREGFLWPCPESLQGTAPIGQNVELVRYLRGQPLFHVAQHGCHHAYGEFAGHDRALLRRRLQHGHRQLCEAGFAPPAAFVAPYDRVSCIGLAEIAARYPVFSTGYYNLQRVPPPWWPTYLWQKKVQRRAHWTHAGCRFLSHPGTLLSCHRPYAEILPAVQAAVAGRDLTVLVTHWWEYFRDGRADEAFVAVLHRVADWLARQADLRVLSFAELRSAC